MDDEQLKLVVDNILDICNVKIKTPTMLDDLRKYITELANNISRGKI